MNTTERIMLSQIEKGKAIAVPSNLSSSGFFVLLSEDATKEQKEAALSIEEIKKLLEKE